MQKLRYEELLVGELEQARAQAPIVYFPIGSLEYHGWHLPLGFDALHAHALCLQAAAQTGGVVLPATFWGTRGHEGFAGSLLLQPETIATLVRDVLAQLAAQGFRLIVICTGHWPDVQGALLRQVAEDYLAEHPGPRILVVDPFNLHPTDRPVEHAGRVETSAMLFLRPDLVDMDQLARPGALHAITTDCTEATREAGEARFHEVLAELVRVVRSELAA